MADQLHVKSGKKGKTFRFKISQLQNLDLDLPWQVKLNEINLQLRYVLMILDNFRNEYYINPNYS